MPIPANRKKSDATLARQALLETPLVFSGFTEYTNPAQQEAILGVLGSEIALRVIPSVSRELDYPKTAICLIEKTISVVRGVKQLVIRFRSHFNRTFNEELKQAGDASFDYGSKTWRLVMTPDSIERIQSVLCHYFILVIEVGREVVM